VDLTENFSVAYRLESFQPSQAHGKQAKAWKKSGQVSQETRSK